MRYSLATKLARRTKNVPSSVDTSFPVVDSSMNDDELHFEPEFCEAEEAARDAMPDIALLEFKNDEPLSDRYTLAVVPEL